MQTGAAWWDTGEAQAVPPILGIMHAPGFPFYTLLGFVWSHVVPLGSYALRMNALSVVSAAAATSVLVATLWEFRLRTPMALVLSFLFAFNPIVIEHVTRAGVEGTFALCASLALYGALRYRASDDARWAIAAGIASAAMLGTHLIGLYVLPAPALLIASRLRVRDLVCFGLTLIVGTVVVFAYLPLRSFVVVRTGIDPSTALGLPAGQQFFNNQNPSSLAGFRSMIFGEQFGAGSSAGAFLNVGAYPSYLKYAIDVLANALGPVAPFATLVGLVVLVRRNPAAGFALAFAGFLVVAFAMTYGALMDANKYFVFTTWIAVVIVGAALAPLEIDFAGAPRRTLAGLAVVLMIVSSTVAAAQMHRGLYDHRHGNDGEVVITEVRAFTPPNAIIDAAFVFATPLAYGIYTAHELDQRSVVTHGPSDWPFIPAWSRTRPVYLIPFTKADVPKNVHVVEIPNTWPTMFRVVP